MSYKTLVTGPITREIMSSILASLANKTDAGGHSVFMGQVRADIKGAKRVKAIEYFSYEKMAEAEAGKIKDSILTEFNDVKSVEILHSVGVVMAGEVSLFVLVSAGHRHHAIDACSKAVEMIKATLPVWKKEIFEDNSTMWKENSLA
jgi:Molybdopterin converting factor, large subunit